MSRRARTDVQISMLDKAGVRPISRRGGARPGAGRKPRGPRRGSAHRARRELRPTTPVHVTLRVLEVIGVLRKRVVYSALRRASLRLATSHPSCRVVHFSIQGDHLHLLVEAASKVALARGMQGFQGSAAKRINAALRPKQPPRRGQVFADRYHAEYITSPRQARNALAYVINNWRKHRWDAAAGVEKLPGGGCIDWYSSGYAFTGWKGMDGRSFAAELPPGFVPLRIFSPGTWLLRIGWRRHGLVDLYEVPGPRPKS